MKKLLPVGFVFLISSVSAQSQKISDTLKIDIIKVYEDVLKMGYESPQLYSVLISEYKKKNDTLKVNHYLTLLKQ